VSSRGALSDQYFSEFGGGGMFYVGSGAIFYFDHRGCPDLPISLATPRILFLGFVADAEAFSEALGVPFPSSAFP